MGTTSEKLTYLNVTKQKLKQAINNIGGEVTDETTFREYVNQLENAYDRLPKTEFEEGESVTLENTLKGKLDFQDGKVGFGQASQESTQGYNLYNLYHTRAEGYVFTNGGITATWLADGKLKINGTATERFALAPVPYSLEAGTYTLAGWLGVKELVVGGGVLDRAMTSSGTATFTLSSAKSENIYIQVSVGDVYDNLIIQPYYYKGTETKPFEKYTGGYSSPSPNWEQEIKYVRGRNKLDVSKNTNGYVLSTTGELNQAEGYCVSDFIPVQQGATYNVSYKLLSSVQDASTTRVGFYDSSKTFISRPFSTDNPYIITIPSNCHYVRLSYQYPARTEMQIEEGSEAHSYLPYNTIEEVVSGKNLFDDSSHKNKDVPSSAGFYINNAPFNLSGGTYRFGVFVDNQLITTPALMALSFKSGGTTVLEKNAPNQDITITDEQASIIDRVSLYFNGIFVSTYSGKKITGVMITTSEITTYEPYITPTSYQLSLGDIELNKIGTYQDYIYKSSGKWYVHKAVEKIRLTRDLGWTTGYVTNDSWATAYIKSNYDVITTEGTKNIISNYAKGIRYNDRNTYVGACVYFELQGLLQFRNSGFTTLNDFLTFLDNNYVYAYFITQTPTETEITGTLAEQLEAFWNGQSLEGTTIIEGNGDLPMIIKVRGLKGAA